MDNISLYKEDTWEVKYYFFINKHESNDLDKLSLKEFKAFIK